MSSRRSLQTPAIVALTFATALPACTFEANLGRWVESDSAAPADGDASAANDAEALALPDGGVELDASLPSDDACPVVTSDAGACVLDGSSFASEDLTVLPGVALTYFASGSPLPAGDYSLEYVDGCWKSGAGAWTVHLEEGGYSLVGGEPEVWIAKTPGIVGTYASLGAYSVYDDCVAANRGQAAVDFHFAGGPLAIELDFGSSRTFHLFVTAGESVGGRSTTFRLRCVGVCR